MTRRVTLKADRTAPHLIVVTILLFLGYFWYRSAAVVRSAETINDQLIMGGAFVMMTILTVFGLSIPFIIRRGKWRRNGIVMRGELIDLVVSTVVRQLVSPHTHRSLKAYAATVKLDNGETVPFTFTRGTACPVHTVGERHDFLVDAAQTPPKIFDFLSRQPPHYWRHIVIGLPIMALVWLFILLISGLIVQGENLAISF